MTVSNNSDQDSFFAEFLEDYFAECDEHLAMIRHHLLRLEAGVDQSPVDGESVQTLFRSFHTLKGLSGMVGIKTAESLAHQMESYLRVLREPGAMLSAAGFDALMVGIKTLEQVIHGHHQPGPGLDIEPVVAQLAAMVVAEVPASRSQVVESRLSLSEGVRGEITIAQAAGERVWQVEFTPNAQRAQAGLNVNYVRDRLQALGRLLHASPRLNPDQSILFDFIVVSPVAEPWAAEPMDGVRWQPYGEGTTAAEGSDMGETDQPGETAIAPPPNELPPLPLLSPPSTVVRVDLPKLDELMRMIGELVISRARLDDYIGQLQGQMAAAQVRPLQELNLTLERQLRDLREGVMRVRLVPIGEVFARMQFVVRDLLRDRPQAVTLQITGQDTEIDKFVVERLLDPLLHLVRNAISHGIETPDERQAAGKPAQGTLHLRAHTAGEMVVIEIEDDGRGVDLPRVVQQAKARHLIPAQGDDHHLEGVDLLDLLCAPGFSTQAEADLTSGRGVGMAIVQNTVRELGGLLEVQTVAGEGTCFRIQLPLTLAIADALIIQVGHHRFAIPQASVREVVELPIAAIAHLEQTEIARYRDQIIPLLHLSHCFHLDSTRPSDRPYPTVITGTPSNPLGLVVDRVLGLREIVVHPLTDPLVRVLAVAGATELGDGHVVLILEVSALMRWAATRTAHRVAAATPP